MTDPLADRRGARARWRYAAVGLIGMTAVGLRVWRIDWGLADQGCFPDEIIFSGRAARFVPLTWASFHMGPRDFQYPALYPYLVGFLTAGANALGVVAHPVTWASSDVILIARWLSTVAGIVTVGVVGWLAARAYDRWTGLAAAALMAVAPFHAMHSHIAATDVLLTVWTVVVMLAALKLADGSRGAAAAAGAGVALACATKYSGLGFAAPVGWALLEAAAATRAASRVLGLTAVTVGATALAYTLSCPPCVFAHADMMRYLDLVHLAAVAPGLLHNNHLVASLGWYGRPYLYELVASLPFVLGLPLYLTAIVGVVGAVWRHTRADRILLAGLLPFFVYIAAYPLTFPRYLMPIVPLLVVLAARAFAGGVPRRRWRFIPLAAVWLYTFVLTASHVARFSFDQHRAVVRAAADALRGRPGGGRVGVPYVFNGLDYYHLEPAVRRAGLTPVVVEPGHWLDSAPDALIVPEWLQVCLRRDEPLGSAAAELTRLTSGEAGYRLAATWRSDYLNRDLYTRLDPAFAGDLWEGEIGFSLWLRNDVP